MNAKWFGLCELGAPRLLQRRIVIRRHVVDADHRAALRKQPPRHMKADEAGGAGDQDRVVVIHSRHSSMPSGLLLAVEHRLDVEHQRLRRPCSSRVTSGQPPLT